MHCLAFSAALALVVGSTQTMACQNAPCRVPGTPVIRIDGFQSLPACAGGALKAAS